MAGLERLLRRSVPFGFVAALGCTGNRDSGQVPNDTGRDSSYADDSGDDSGHTGDTGDTSTYGSAPELESSIQITAYLNQEQIISIADYVTQYEGGGILNCRVNEPPFEVTTTDYGCTLTFTVTDEFLVGESYNLDVEIEDDNGEGNQGVLELTIADGSSTLSLGTLADLSGYTNEILSGSGSYSGDAASANISLDSALDAVVSSATASLSGSNVNYSLAFNNDIDWSDYTLGTIEGTATVEICDSVDYCVSQNVDVVGYAPTEILITAQTADDKDTLSSATIYVDCDSGESYTLTPNADGEATAYLNNSEDVCMITSDAGSDYAVYSWDHEFDASSEDLVSDGYYEVWAEVYDNFTPSDLESEYGTNDCIGGLLSGYMDNSRMLLMYAAGLYDPIDSVYASEQTFERYSEGQLTDTIKYWVSETNLEDGSTTDADLYTDMYDAVSDGLERINTDNSLGYTFFEEAGVIDDANYVVFWGESGNTNTSSSTDSNDVIGTYSSGYYSVTELRTASERTVMEEAFNTVSADLCGDSISDGGTSFTTIDWFVWNNIHFAKYQNIMERTY